MAIEIQHRMEVDTPIEKVFAYVTNPENDADWSGVIVEVPSIEGGMAVGESWPVIVDTPVGQSELVYECTEYEPPTRYSLRTIEGFLGGRVTSTEAFSFTPDGNTTRVDVLARFTIRGVLRILEPVLARMIRADVEKSFQRLHSILDQRGTE